MFYLSLILLALIGALNTILCPECKEGNFFRFSLRTASMHCNVTPVTLASQYSQCNLGPLDTTLIPNS